MKKNKLGVLPAVPYIVWMAIFVVVPLILVVFYAFTNEAGGFTLANFSQMGTYTKVFARSFSLSAVATAICLLIGYPIAYVLSKETPMFQRVAMMLIMLPMWINFLLRTYAWMSILENTGLLNTLFDKIGLFDLINWIGLHLASDPGKYVPIEHFNMINTQGAVVLGMVYNYLPFMIMPIHSVIVKIDRSMLEAARDLGADSKTTFRKVIFPLSLPGVLSGVTMVFVPSISTFYISQKLGNGKFFLIGDAIEGQYVANNLHFAAAIAFILMVILLVAMAVVKYVAGRYVYGGE